MSYILKISNANTPEDSVIQHLITNHATPQDDVIVEYVNDKLPNGFSITKIDRVLSNVAKKSPELKDFLNIREYKFVERITAKENDDNIKEELEHRGTGKIKP